MLFPVIVPPDAAPSASDDRLFSLTNRPVAGELTLTPAVMEL